MAIYCAVRARARIPSVGFVPIGHRSRKKRRWKKRGGEDEGEATQANDEPDSTLPRGSLVYELVPPIEARSWIGLFEAPRCNY